jgi:hypothetical protein
MKRTLSLAGALAALLALPATASAFSGVAVAKDQARHSVVVAAKGGLVRTVRAPGRFGSLRVGHGVVYSARRLSDGTFRASSIRMAGLARTATLRGTIVRNQRLLHRLLLSTGGSVLVVRSPSRGFASHRAGTRVEVRVSITGKGLEGKALKTLGEASTLELEGIFLSVNGDQLRLAVEHRGEVFATIPAGFQLPELKPGDEIEAIVSVDAAGAFTLVSVQSDDENDDDHEGTGEHNGRIEVHGSITQLGDGTITVQPREGSPVVCAVPAGTDLSSFRVNDRVEMKCGMVDGTLTLLRIKQEDDGDDDGGDGSGDD